MLPVKMSQTEISILFFTISPKGASNFIPDLSDQANKS